MSKKILLAANWKLHMDVQQASLLLHRLHERIRIHRDVEVVLAPTMLCLQPLSLQIDHRKFKLAAQNAYQQDEGPFTGEVSFAMLRGLVDYAFIGHSDRRTKFGETPEDTRDKVAAAVRNRVTPILCIGETLTERRAGETSKVIHDQLTTAINHLTAAEVAKMVVAYEPVWALSNGTNFRDTEVPKPDMIAKAAQLIRHHVQELYGRKAAQQLRVVYGGSTYSATARGFLEVEGIDGLLVGGASMNYHEFSTMVGKAVEVARLQKA